MDRVISSETLQRPKNLLFLSKKFLTEVEPDSISGEFTAPEQQELMDYLVPVSEEIHAQGLLYDAGVYLDKDKLRQPLLMKLERLIEKYAS